MLFSLYNILLLFVLILLIIKLKGISNMYELYKFKILNSNYYKDNISAIILIPNGIKRNIFKKIIGFISDEFILTQKLLKVIKHFKKINKAFKLYINIDSNKFEKIMKNNKISEVYIYSHGTRYGVVLVDKYYEYKNLFKKNIIKKNYIAQVHCGNINKNPKYNLGITLNRFTKQIFYYNKYVNIFNIRYFNRKLINNKKLIIKDNIENLIDL